VDVERREPKTEQEVFCSKIKRLTLLQLGNRLDQAKRGIRKLTKALDNTTLPTLQKPLQEALTVLNYRAGWIAGEIADRADGPDLIDATSN
jgi:hypothetical protein